MLASVRGALSGSARHDASPGWAFPVTPVADVVSRFVAEAALVGCIVVEARDGDWWGALRPVVGDHQAVFAGPEVVASATGLPVVDADEAAARPAEVLGLVRASLGIAESGSVVIEADRAHLPSLLTETSAVILSREDILPGLETLPPAGPEVRARILVTGPSRTADIEKRLVLGAHGPRKMVVVLV